MLTLRAHLGIWLLSLGVAGIYTAVFKLGFWGFLLTSLGVGLGLTLALFLFLIVVFAIYWK